MHKMIENEDRIQQQSPLIDSQCQHFPFTLTRTCKTLKVLAFLTARTQHAARTPNIPRVFCFHLLLVHISVEVKLLAKQICTNMHPPGSMSRLHSYHTRRPHCHGSRFGQTSSQEECGRNSTDPLNVSWPVSRYHSASTWIFIASEGVDGVTDACVIDPSSPALRRTPTLLSHTSVNCEAS